MIDQAATTRTFLFTDIEGSTRLWEDHRDAMAAALEAHDRLLASAVGHTGGTVVKTTGDGLLAVFDAVDAAIGADHRVVTLAGVGGTGKTRLMLQVAAESLREAAGAAMLPVEREEYEAAVAQMRRDADGPALDGAWAEGRQMGPETAVEFAVALDETKRSRPLQPDTEG